MKRFLLASAWLIGLFLGVGCGKKDVPPGPVWTPDAAQLDNLDAERTVDRFLIRPPRDFKFVEQPRNRRELAAVTWTCPNPEVDGSVLGIVVSNKPKLSLETHLLGSMVDLQKSIADWKNSATETGTIQGMPFVKVTWTGTAKGSTFNGFIYLTQDGGQVAEIHGLTREYYAPTTLPLLEAAARTFRKK